MYANAFLNSDMLLEIRAKYPEFNITSAVAGGLAITGGGLVVVAVLTGTVVIGVYNMVGTEVKEFVGGTLNDLFDTLRNLKYLVGDI